jgi:hypothetical protein
VKKKLKAKENIKFKTSFKQVKGSQAKFKSLLKLFEDQAKKQAKERISAVCPKSPPTNPPDKLTVRKILIGQKWMEPVRDGNKNQWDELTDRMEK